MPYSFLSKIALLVLLFTGAQKFVLAQSTADTLPGVERRIRGKDTIFLAHKELRYGRILPPQSNFGEKKPPELSQAQWDKLTPFQYIQAVLIRHSSYSQMCSMPKQFVHAQFSYGGMPSQHDYLKASGFELLRKRRKDIIGYYLNSGRIEHITDLNILLDLNAVELLPELLKREKKMRPYAFACIEGKMEFDTSIVAPGSERHYFTQSYSFLLSAIVMLLRQERYAPMLQSNMEAAFKTKFTGLNTDTLIAEKNKSFAFPDPFYKYGRGSMERVETDINAANVALIEKWADDYIANQLERKKNTAAQRMTPWSVSR